jgi:hypothetical protein
VNKLAGMVISLKSLMCWVVIVGGVLFTDGHVIAQGDMDAIRVEVFLARDQRGDAEDIRNQFRTLSVENVRFQFFRAGRPPDNIAIGRNVPPAIARLAMDLAIQYGQGINLILPEALLPANWIGIGTSAFDEQNQIPISPKSLERLRDSSLNFEDFHALYRELARLPKIF